MIVEARERVPPTALLKRAMAKVGSNVDNNPMFRFD
jgi:hypothetical protein